MKSQIPPNMHSVNPTRPASAAAGNLYSRGVLVALVLLFVLSASITLWLVYDLFGPQVLAFFQLPTPSPIATVVCENSTLALGAYTYPMDSVPFSGDGGIPTLARPAGTTWWLSGTSNPFVFIFVPAIGSLDLQSALGIGDKLVAQWRDCQQQEFFLSDFQLGVPDAQAFFNQASPGIFVIVQPVGGKEEYMIHGLPLEIQSEPTP